MFIPMASRQRTAVDTFCGAGGLSLGLSQAGFKVGAAFDNNERSVDTYRENLGPQIFRADATATSGTELLKRAGVKHLDLLVGGPPCQGFSAQKRGAHLGDPRNALVLEYLRLVEEIHPKAFLMENVAGLAHVRGAHLVALFGTLEDYDLVRHFYVAADYGVAQTRRRFILVGIRKDQVGTFKVPVPTTPAPHWLTIRDALGDMPEPPSDYSVHPDFANHQRARVTAINIERFSHVPEGGGWRDIPFDLRLPCHQVVDVKSGGWPDVYGRLRWDGQCPTVTGGFDSFTRGRYGHPTYDRPLTPREAARLQGFPDDFVFVGTRQDIRHQIGNAVPVPLAKAIGLAILEALDGKSAKRVPRHSLSL